MYSTTFWIQTGHRIETEKGKREDARKVKKKGGGEKKNVSSIAVPNSKVQKKGGRFFDGCHFQLYKYKNQKYCTRFSFMIFFLSMMLTLFGSDQLFLNIIFLSANATTPLDTAATLATTFNKVSSNLSVRITTPFVWL